MHHLGIAASVRLVEQMQDVFLELLAVLVDILASLAHVRTTSKTLGKWVNEPSLRWEDQPP